MSDEKHSYYMAGIANLTDAAHQRCLTVLGDWKESGQQE